MEREAPSRVEVILAGVGGMGILVAGRLLAAAGLQKYKYVSWVPSYGEARRGGLSECTTVLSDQEIASPILDQAQTVILCDGSQLKAFEGRVRPGGIIIAEGARLSGETEKKSFRLLPVSGLETAINMGGMLYVGLILLGAYTELAKPLPPGMIEEEMQRKYGNNDSVLQRNMHAFRQGIALGRGITV